MKMKLFTLILSPALVASINSKSPGHLDGIGMSLKEKAQWNNFVKSVECQLSPSAKYAYPASKKFPVFKITLRYKGSEPIKIMWDSNFGRVLWRSRFILQSSLNKKKATTKELLTHTGNTYPPRKKVLLEKGTSITSILDFTQLPATYAQNLFLGKGDVDFSLHAIQYKDAYSSRKISNYVTIAVE